MLKGRIMSEQIHTLRGCVSLGEHGVILLSGWAAREPEQVPGNEEAYVKLQHRG